MKNTKYKNIDLKIIKMFFNINICPVAQYGYILLPLTLYVKSFILTIIFILLNYKELILLKQITNTKNLQR